MEKEIRTLIKKWFHKEFGVTDLIPDASLDSLVNEMEALISVCKCGSDRTGETKLWCCNQCGKRCEEF